MTNYELIKHLRLECETIQSRLLAILNCDDAIDSLMAPDVFGEKYRNLLELDCKALANSMELADVALKNFDS